MRRLQCAQSVVGQLESGCVFMYALRVPAPKNGHTYIQGEVSEYGHLDERTARSKFAAYG